MGVNLAAPANLLYPPTPETSMVTADQDHARVYCLGDGDPNHYQSRIVPNSAMSMGMHDVAGSDPLVLKTYQPVADALDRAQFAAPPGQPGSVDSVRPIVDRLNAKYLISPRPLAGAGLDEAVRGDVYVYRNADAFGVAKLMCGGPSPTVDTFSDGNVGFSYASDQPSWLQTSLIYDPGWTATVDGHPATASPEPGSTGLESLFLSVPAPSGAHRITLAYQPAAFRVGLYVSVLSWLMVGLVCTRRLIVE
jgi:hypothetical protein